MSQIKDKLWLWGQSPDSHRCHKLPLSRMTAMEGCAHFGIDHCRREVMYSHPRPPFDQESIAMEPQKEVGWSIMDTWGTTEHNNRPLPLELIKKQARQYEKWILNGQSDGLELCSNCCADVGLDTVRWTRDWLKEISTVTVR